MDDLLRKIAEGSFRSFKDAGEMKPIWATLRLWMEIMGAPPNFYTADLKDRDDANMNNIGKE